MVWSPYQADNNNGHFHALEPVDRIALYVQGVQVTGITSTDLCCFSPDLAELGAGPDPVMYLTSNSMGGAVGIGLLQRLGPDNPFRAMALLGPMINVNYTHAPELTLFLSDQTTLYSSSKMIRKLSVTVSVNSRHLLGRVLRKNPKIASVNWLNVA